jgi:hypothetical protein
VRTLLHHLPRLEDLVVRDLRDRQHLVYVDPRHLLDRLPVGGRVDAAAVQQVPEHLARDRVIGHLVDAQLL